MKTSKNGIEFIKSFESFKSNPYLCPAGVASIGYGNTYYENGTKVKLTDNPISIERADELFAAILKKFEDKVNNRLTVEVSQNQFDAIVSHTYNTGGSDTLFRLINYGELETAAIWIRTRYTTGGGAILKGLVRRRKEESILFTKK